MHTRREHVEQHTVEVVPGRMGQALKCFAAKLSLGLKSSPGVQLLISPHQPYPHMPRLNHIWTPLHLQHSFSFCQSRWALRHTGERGFTKKRVCVVVQS